MVHFHSYPEIIEIEVDFLLKRRRSELVKKACEEQMRRVVAGELPRSQDAMQVLQSRLLRL